MDASIEDYGRLKKEEERSRRASQANAAEPTTDNDLGAREVRVLQRIHQSAGTGRVEGEGRGGLVQ